MNNDDYTRDEYERELSQERYERRQRPRRWNIYDDCPPAWDEEEEEEDE
jgi:hypothetical protein